MLNDLRNCQQCGRLFAFVGGRSICPACIEKEEQDFLIVRKYVREHPGDSIMDVAENTEVSEERILQFLRDGRLKSSGFKEVLKCERCGKKISQGRFCQQCILSLDSEIRTVISGKADKKEDAIQSPDNREKMFIKKDSPRD